MPDSPSPPQPRCTTCRRHTTSPPVCHACLTTATKHREDLPDLLTRLADGAGVPTSPGLAEYVSGGAFASRPPVMFPALSLTFVSPAAVANVLAKPSPPLGSAGDSIPLWVVGWAAVWRAKLGHHQPVRPRRQRWNPHTPPPLPPRWMWRTDPAERAQKLAAVLDERARQAKHGARVLLGLGSGDVREPDPVTAGWLARFGTARHAHRVETDLAYLATWQDRALAELASDAPAYVLGLRSLVGQARSVLGERSSVTYLGRCPEPVTDGRGREQMVEVLDETGGVVMRLVRCEGRLSRDAEVAVVVCPRCRKETSERGLWALAMAVKNAYGTAMKRDAWVG